MNEQTKKTIDDLVKNNKCVLFMKGTPDNPQCGFSSNTIGILKELVGSDFVSSNVLENQDIREGIKEYGNWPTIPQLYIDGELVGGNDIVTEMFNTGELQTILGLQKPERTPANITISDKARENIKAGTENMGNNVLKLSVDSQFNTRFSIEAPKSYEIISEVGDINIYMDVGTAKRAEGVSIDWVEDLQGAGLVINNPNQPKAVIQLSSIDLKTGINDGKYQHIYDVRSEAQFMAQTIPGAKRLDKVNMQLIETLPKETPLVFVCTSGATSQGACDFFHKKGFTDVSNLIGGVVGYRI